MAKQFHISNTLLSSLSSLNVKSILVTTKCKAGFLSNHIVELSGAGVEVQINNIFTQYIGQVIKGLDLITEVDGKLHSFSVVNFYPNGKVASMCGDLLKTLEDRSIRHAFKNSDDILNYKLHDLPFNLPKVEATYNK